MEHLWLRNIGWEACELCSTDLQLLWALAGIRCLARAESLSRLWLQPSRVLPLLAHALAVWHARVLRRNTRVLPRHLRNEPGVSLAAQSEERQLTSELSPEIPMTNTKHEQCDMSSYILHLEFLTLYLTLNPDKLQGKKGETSCLNAYLALYVDGYPEGDPCNLKSGVQANERWYPETRGGT